ncbi:MAG TPA: hypothetical protein VMF13_00035 [Luteitalea sp.]|nr:hypothetical protein [Luteitalea sp.]
MHSSRYLLLTFLLVLTPSLTMARGQQAQNPSPMSDTTRPHPRLAESRPDGERETLSLGELFVPKAAVRRKRPTMPLLVHFHGASWLIEQHVAKAAPQAALVTINLGAGSSRYAAPFADPARFTTLLDEAADAVGRLTGQRPTWSSVTLTSWSAGYGATRAVLANQDAAKRVNAVVLLDGLHASYVVTGDPAAPRGKDPAVNVSDLDAFTRLASAALSGHTRFWVTHSEVYPGTYASTSETADALLASLRLERRPVLKPGPIGMQQLSEAGRGGFQVLGFAGNSAPDHVDHLQALGEWLRRWKVIR